MYNLADRDTFLQLLIGNLIFSIFSHKNKSWK